ncbi:MAG: hypothetical protein E7160_03610 [Firmicutes bacterium]|nr:hypothetical protein [Bacillota bacterium]
MKQEKRLSIGMALLFLVVFIVFGVIIVNEKFSFYYIPKVDKKLNNYFNEHYKSIKDDVIINKTTHKNMTYTLKVISKENKNLYFKINYQDRKISSTYKKDYIEGKTLLSKISKDIEKEINKNIKYEINVKIDKNLNDFSTLVKERIINENNLVNLKIYDIYTELEVNKLTNKNIYNEILELYKTLQSKSITPRTYNITITNKEDITKSIEINGITSELIESNDLILVINDIINKKPSDILNKYDITYKYLN